MDSYSKFRNEFIATLTQVNTLSLDAVLQTLDSIAIDYTVTARQFDDQATPLDILSEYIDSCRYEKMSTGTIENYQLIIGKMFRKLQLPIEEITTNDLRTYLRHYQLERNISDSTLNKYREYIRSFFNWCCNEGYATKNPAANLKPIRSEKKQKEFLTQTDLEYVRQACETKRDLAIVEVLYSTGCRVSELCNLRIDDIEWTAKTVHLFGKGKKHRISYLNAKAEISLKNYLAERQDDCEYLIVTERGHHQMTASAVQKVLRSISEELCEEVNKPITPHVFRHTTATTAMQHGMPVEDIQALLGHENIETTMIYARTSNDSVKMNHKKYII